LAKRTFIRRAPNGYVVDESHFLALRRTDAQPVTPG
jgi:hypothetical protein